MACEDIQRHTIPINAFFVIRKKVIAFLSNKYLNLPTGLLFYLAGTSVHADYGRVGLYSLLSG